MKIAEVVQDEFINDKRLIFWVQVFCVHTYQIYSNNTIRKQNIDKIERKWTDIGVVLVERGNKQAYDKMGGSEEMEKNRKKSRAHARWKYRKLCANINCVRNKYTFESITQFRRILIKR